MKIFYPIALAMLALSGCSEIKQALSSKEPWDSTYRPDIFDSRVGMIHSFKSSTNDIVLVGNSVIFWSDLDKLMDNPKIKNHGIPGDISFGVLERLDRIASDHPAKIIIQIGINDLQKGVPVKVMQQNYNRMISKIRRASPETAIVFLSLLPTNETFGKLTEHYGHDQQIVEVNQFMNDLAKKRNIIYIDLHKHFRDNSGRLEKSLSWDGLHLNLEGNKLLARVLRDSGQL